MDRFGYATRQADDHKGREQEPGAARQMVMLSMQAIPLAETW
jgi:hypothetical protein